VTKSSLLCLVVWWVAVVLGSNSANAQVPFGTFQRSTATIGNIGANNGQMAITLTVNYRPSGCESGVWIFSFVYIVPRTYSGGPISDVKDRGSGTIYCGGVPVKQVGQSSGYLTGSFYPIDQNQVGFSAIAWRYPDFINFGAFSGVYDRSVALARRHKTW